MKKERAKDDIAQLDRVQVFMKSGLPGFSFGSELFLIFAMWKEAPTIARIMLACRLFFPLLLIRFIALYILIKNGQKCMNMEINGDDPHKYSYGVRVIHKRKINVKEELSIVKH